MLSKQFISWHSILSLVNLKGDILFSTIMKTVNQYNPPTQATTESTCNDTLNRLHTLNKQIQHWYIALHEYSNNFKTSQKVLAPIHTDFVHLSPEDFAYIAAQTEDENSIKLHIFTNNLGQFYTLPTRVSKQVETYLEERKKNSISFLQVNYLQATYFQKFKDRYFTEDWNGNLVYKGERTSFTSEFNGLMEEFDSVIHDPNFNFHKHQTYILASFMEPLYALCKQHSIEDDFIQEVYELIQNIKLLLERQAKNNVKHSTFLNDTLQQISTTQNQLKDLLAQLHRDPFTAK